MDDCPLCKMLAGGGWGHTCEQAFFVGYFFGAAASKLSESTTMCRKHAGMFQDFASSIGMEIVRLSDKDQS